MYYVLLLLLLLLLLISSLLLFILFDSRFSVFLVEILVYSGFIGFIGVLRPLFPTAENMGVSANYREGVLVGI